MEATVTCIEHSGDSAQRSASLTSPFKKQYKTPWYAAVMACPEAMAKMKEYRKQRYEAQKKKTMELEPQGIPTPEKPYVKPSPEAKRRYNEKYYSETTIK